MDLSSRNNNDIREQDESKNQDQDQDQDQDQLSPLQGSAGEEDSSAFSAPLGLMPTFKPRKSNRISVLAYPSDGSHLDSAALSQAGSGALPAPVPLGGGGPPGLFGSGARAGVSPSPPLPSSSAGGPPPGMKLPPPPMKTAVAGTTPVPYTKGDFRTAGIEHHWNDPPTQIFAKKLQSGEGSTHDFGPMKETLAKIVAECATKVHVSQKRMFEDTSKRLHALQEQMDKSTVKESVVGPLGEMIQALSNRSFAQCQVIHAKLMQTEFESEGKWLLGFKRLMDLYSTTPSG
ncbi:hypothetical protein BGZ83_011932 [Gryganskiella cystojenkinii]|nr:hypothetical protein BGZ83_011932 [Gryganskiella cystojenkinii]